MSVNVSSSTDVGPVSRCDNCLRWVPDKIIVNGLCSYCRRALGLMPDQLTP